MRNVHVFALFHNRINNEDIRKWLLILLSLRTMKEEMLKKLILIQDDVDKF